LAGKILLPSGLLNEDLLGGVWEVKDGRRGLLNELFKVQIGISI
jgi:hypothetical protein